MQPIMIVMAILGCADDGMQCQQVRTVSTRYASVAACNTAAETELGRASDLDYPTILARCQPVLDGRVADAGLITPER